MERANKGQMTGEQLFEYYRSQNSEYASIVRMLPYAVGSFEEAYRVLEECQKGNKRLYAYYPGTDTISPELKTKLDAMEPIGSIIDGSMYLLPLE